MSTQRSRLKNRKKRSGSSSQMRARIDERTKNLTRTLKKGEVAVINHVDIDRVAAESLVACQPAAVLNAAKSTSGRYPNLGPSIIVEAGIPLVDDLGGDIMQLHEYDVLRLDGGDVYRGEELIASGKVQTPETVEERLAEAREGLSVQIEAFAANTMEYLRQERDYLFDGVGVPQVKTAFEGRHVLVVVRGYHYKEDLRSLRPYIREYRPLLVGVDGGADAILDEGLKPDMVIGDMDSVSDKALRCGAEVVVHAYRDGRAPGVERVKQLGVDHVVFPATGTSEDAAMLLADNKGAQLIVALGTHATLIEFLDKGRAGMASTFLTRLQVGGKLVDAKGVSRLYRARISNFQLALLVFAGLLCLGIALSITPAGQTFLSLLGAYMDDIVNFFRALVGLAPSAPTS